MNGIWYRYWRQNRYLYRYCYGCWADFHDWGRLDWNEGGFGPWAVGINKREAGIGLSLKSILSGLRTAAVEKKRVENWQPSGAPTMNEMAPRWCKSTCPALGSGLGSRQTPLGVGGRWGTTTHFMSTWPEWHTITTVQQAFDELKLYSSFPIFEVVGSSCLVSISGRWTVKYYLLSHNQALFPLHLVSSTLETNNG